jgi:isoaspartyl peptidase/L-asparaginase-like protein (Ntn-hydrolase superfamily)
MSRSALAAVGTAALGQAARASQDPLNQAAERPLLVSTWAFGRAANEAALQAFQRGGSTLDAVEQGIGVIEADPNNASVGIGGIPNAEGVVQLDACIMLGPGHRAGSVAALERILHPISVARRVMEKTRHVMLAGEGAHRFALQQGFAEVELLTEERKQEWLQWRAAQATGSQGHDTITLLALDAQGHLAGGCSTSGLGYKTPGRVGDSPIIGGGLYVDDEVGAAGATGLGEIIMRQCGSFQVVERMREGLTPQEACLETVRRIARKDADAGKNSFYFVALDRHGRFGAAGTGKGFEYAVTHPGSSGILHSAGLDD